MRILRFEDESGQVHYGLDEGVVQDGVATGHPVLLKGDPYQGLEPTGEKAKVLRLLAPVVPTNILCIGRNYVEHIKELGNVVPEYPILFIKNNGSINHPGAPIRLPKCQLKGPEVDYEGELAVVIGKAAFNVTEEKALDYVLGFTVGNDVSARNWQRHGGGGQWCRGKGFDTFCPLGPSLVTPDEISDPQRLHIQSRLNGEVMQDSHTGRMIHTVAALISFLSQDTTLLPGTVILTGTPSGVGSARSPQLFLKDGDMIEVEVEGIGVLRNPVVE
jgi:2-keto-4-pentenoate hydratase/2-oxohepta-3-ene-1,7-dioic acid hydratase in catechol pathway